LQPVTRQPIALESCSNHLRIWQVLLDQIKKFFFVSGDVTMEACFRAFVAEVAWLWAPTQWFFGSRFFWKPGYHPSF